MAPVPKLGTVSTASLVDRCCARQVSQDELTRDSGDQYRRTRVDHLRNKSLHAARIHVPYVRPTQSTTRLVVHRHGFMVYSNHLLHRIETSYGVRKMALQSAAPLETRHI